MLVQTKNGLHEVSSISLEEAHKAFQEVLQDKYRIPFYTANNRVGNCVLRAYRMSEILFEEKGLKTLKSFVHALYETDQNGEELYDVSGERFMISDISFYHQRLNTFYAWDYHTAPVICVKNGVKHELYTLDPSLYDQPVPHDQWRAELTNNEPLQNIGKNYLVNMYHLSPTPEGTNNLQTRFTNENTNNVKRTLESEDWETHKELQRLINN